MEYQTDKGLKFMTSTNLEQKVTIVYLQSNAGENVGD